MLWITSAQESLREANKTREEIRRSVASAVIVRFVVSIVLRLRLQLSVNGGDILRQVFTITGL